MPQPETTLEREDLYEKIRKMERLPREELLSMTNKEFVRYMKLLRLRNEL